MAGKGLRYLSSKTLANHRFDLVSKVEPICYGSMASGVRHTIHQCTANLSNSRSTSPSGGYAAPKFSGSRTEMSARVMLSPTCEDLMACVQALQHQILNMVKPEKTPYPLVI
jgi:hypothetical protein